MFFLRVARNSAALILVRSLPPTSIEPAVGVHRPLSIRISVDFPEPDSPMTTKISPSSTSKLASITAAVPYSLTSSAVAPERNLGRASAARRPNTLYAFLTVIAAMILQSLGSAVAGWGGRKARRKIPAKNRELIKAVEKIGKTLLRYAWIVRMETVCFVDNRLWPAIIFVLWRYRIVMRRTSRNALISKCETMFRLRHSVGAAFRGRREGWPIPGCGA